MNKPASWPGAVGIVAAVAGCQAFTMGNPLLPRARLVATPQTGTTTVTITPTSAKTYTFTVSPQVTNFQIAPVQGDLAPAATITAYSIQWFDSTGATISPSLIPMRTQGVSVLLPRGQAAPNGSATGTTGSPTGSTGSTGTSGQVDIPVVSSAVTSYGFDNGYTPDPVLNVAVPRTGAWSEFLTGEVTFSGRDENGWPVVGPDGISPLIAYFQLQFVTQASGSTGVSGG